MKSSTNSCQGAVQNYCHGTVDRSPTKPLTPTAVSPQPCSGYSCTLNPGAGSPLQGPGRERG
eukprot:1485408-Prymnesium_polylepis.2